MRISNGSRDMGSGWPKRPQKQLGGPQRTIGVSQERSKRLPHNHPVRCRMLKYFDPPKSFVVPLAGKNLRSVFFYPGDAGAGLLGRSDLEDIALLASGCESGKCLLKRSVCFEL